MARGLNRRGWLASVGAGLVSGMPRNARAQTPPPAASEARRGRRMRSRSRIFSRAACSSSPEKGRAGALPGRGRHSHPTFRAACGGVPHGEAVRHARRPAELLALMERRNLRTLVNLTGGVGSGLAESGPRVPTAHPDRFVVFTEPSFDRIAEPGYAAWQADELARAKRAGARGLKILKVLGLFLASRSHRAAREGGRRPLRSDVGSLRSPRSAGRDARVGSDGVLPPDRRAQRALRRAAAAS